MSHQFNFVLKKLILVDSAGFCYSEIELDKHTILLGEGNVGKSSLLNCIRLFLLPEVNFNKAKDKFNFRSSNGDEYDKDQSFGHYFPSKYSHLIIEVEKIIGGKKYTHCQILSRGNNLAFERIFTTLSYNEIRPLFWQVEEDDQHQIGSRVDKLSTQEVFANIKSNDKYCITVKDPQKLKDLMYARDILSEVAMRYSLFPLNDASEENVESLRALILMLFDMKTSNKAVAKAVANLIESEKKETTDALSFDIQSFMSTHDQLKLEEQKLIDIENKTNEYKQLTSDFSSYSSLSSSESDFVDFYLYLNKTLNYINKQASQSATVISNFQKELRPLNGEIAEQNQIIFSANRNIKKCTKYIDAIKKDISKAEAEISLYGDTDITEIIEILDDDIKETTERIKEINDADARRNRIIKLQNQIDMDQSNLQQLELEISNSEFAIKQQLSLDSLTLLNSLSQQLTLANPGRQLTEQEFTAIQSFQNLFEDQGYSYSFFGSSIQKSKSFSTRNLQKEIENIQSEITAKQSEKKSLENQATENPLVIENKLKDHNRKLSDANRVKLLISNHQENKLNLKIYSKQQSDEQEVVNNTQPLVKKLIDKQGELTELIEAEQSKQTSIEEQQEKLQTLNNLAQGTTHAYPKIQRQLEKQEKYSGESIEVTEGHLRKLQKNLLEVEQLRTKIIDTLKSFVTDKFVDADQDLFRPSPLPSVIQNTFMELKRIYDELEDQRLLLRSKTQMHNDSVSSYVGILDKNYEHIERFENQLNRSFKGISINDLNEIEVSIHIDNRFSNLIKEIHKSYNKFTDQTLSEQFYIRLQAFSDAFFKSGERNKLVMSDIIKEVSYRVKKDGHDGWQTKQQSTSTTALINLKLVRMLLAKLRADSCMVQLPVIMDEAANINVDQYEWLLDDIRKSGFFLFTAGTHSSGAELVHMIGHHYDVDALKTAKPYTKERSRVVWGGPQAFFNENDFGLYKTDNQIELLEGTDETI
jgi:hypothetical protein